MGLFDGIMEGIGDIASIAGTVGSVATGNPIFAMIGNAVGQSNANDFNAQQAADARAFEKGMYESRYQMQVADLKKAGLNPMLAYGQSPAAVPPSPIAHAENVMSGAINSALTAQLQKAQIEKLEADAEASKGTALNQAAQAMVNGVMVDKVKQETLTSQASANQLYESGNQLRALSALQSVEYNKVLMEIDKIAQDTKLSAAEVQRIKAQIPVIMAEGGLINANTESSKANAALRNLEIPQAKNFADQQDTAWMKYINPYLPGFAKASSGVSAAAAGGYFLRK